MITTTAGQSVRIALLVLTLSLMALGGCGDSENESAGKKTTEKQPAVESSAAADTNTADTSAPNTTSAQASAADTDSGTTGPTAKPVTADNATTLRMLFAQSPTTLNPYLAPGVKDRESREMPGQRRGISHKCI